MRYLLFLFLVAPLFAVSSTPVSAQRTIVCQSLNSSYRYCRANTHDKVRLKQRFSRARCTEGRSWGYDRNGIWVDDGCQAEFEYGRSTRRSDSRRQESRRDRDDDDSNVGAAVAVGAIALALGAAAVAADNDNHHRHQSHHNSSSRRDDDRGSSHRGSRPPSWMIGTFEDRNDRRKEMIVHSDGTVDMYWPGGRRASGEYRNGIVQMGNGDDLRIERERGGVWLINTRISRDSPRNQNHYVRVR